MQNSNVLFMETAVSITPERLEAFDEAATVILAKRLEDDDTPPLLMVWLIGIYCGR